MCGLAGFFKFSRQAEGNFDLEGSTRRLLHRGPDEEGYYQDEQAGLGVCRLSIIDLQGGRQPIPNETKNVWVAFNGEIYNYRELRRDLENRGHAFATRSDTEVLVHGYEEWGEELPLRLRGMFAFAIYDQRSAVSGQRSAVGGRLFLARDHFGIKPGRSIGKRSTPTSPCCISRSPGRFFSPSALSLRPIGWSAKRAICEYRGTGISNPNTDGMPIRRKPRKRSSALWKTASGPCWSPMFPWAFF
jgi:hypothetical protein